MVAATKRWANRFSPRTWYKTRKEVRIKRGGREGQREREEGHQSEFIFLQPRSCTR